MVTYFFKTVIRDQNSHFQKSILTTPFGTRKYANLTRRKGLKFHINFANFPIHIEDIWAGKVTDQWALSGIPMQLIQYLSLFLYLNNFTFTYICIYPTERFSDIGCLAWIVQYGTICFGHQCFNLCCSFFRSSVRKKSLPIACFSSQNICIYRVFRKNVFFHNSL